MRILLSTVALQRHFPEVEKFKRIIFCEIVSKFSPYPALIHLLLVIKLSTQFISSYWVIAHERQYKSPFRKSLVLYISQGPSESVLKLLNLYIRWSRQSSKSSIFRKTSANSEVSKGKCDIRTSEIFDFLILFSVFHCSNVASIRDHLRASIDFFTFFLRTCRGFYELFKLSLEFLIQPFGFWNIPEYESKVICSLKSSIGFFQ